MTIFLCKIKSLYQKPKHCLGQSGQVAVEYILMLLVIVSVFIPLAKKFHERFVGDADCTDPQNISLVCMAGKFFDQSGFENMTLQGAPKD